MGVNTHGELAHSQPSTVTGGVTLDVSEYPPTHTHHRQGTHLYNSLTNVLKAEVSKSNYSNDGKH